MPSARVVYRDQQGRFAKPDGRKRQRAQVYKDNKTIDLGVSKWGKISRKRIAKAAKSKAADRVLRGVQGKLAGFAAQVKEKAVRIVQRKDIRLSDHLAEDPYQTTEDKRRAFNTYRFEFESLSDAGENGIALRLLQWARNNNAFSINVLLGEYGIIIETDEEVDRVAGTGGILIPGLADEKLIELMNDARLRLALSLANLKGSKTFAGTGTFMKVFIKRRE